MNRSDYLILFARLNGNLTARDVDGKTPFDLATAEETKNIITRLIDDSTTTQNLSDKSPPLSPKSDSALNQDSSGVLTRIKSKVVSRLSSQKEGSTSHSAHEFLSLRLPDKKYEHDPKSKSPPLSPRDKDKAKPKQITTTKIRGILKTTRTTKEKYDPRSTHIDINQQGNKKFFKHEIDTLITGSRTTYVPMPSVADNSNNDRLIPPQNPPSSTIKIAATQADSNNTNLNSTGSIFVPMPRLNRDVFDNTTAPATLEQKNYNQKQIRLAGFSDQLNAEDVQNKIHGQDHENQDKSLSLTNINNQLALNNNISSHNQNFDINASSLQPPKTEAHFNTQKTSDNSNLNPAEQSASSRYTPTSFFNSLEKLVTIFKSDNLEAFQDYLNHKINNPNHKLSGFGRPYIIQAFLSNAGRIFIYLLQQGAHLDSLTNSGKQLSDYITAENKEERIAFLKQVKEGISSKACTSRINNEQDKLIRLEKEFMNKLYNNGLIKPFKRQDTSCNKNVLIKISKQHQISVELVQGLYELCLGSTIEKGKERIDTKETN